MLALQESSSDGSIPRRISSLRRAGVGVGSSDDRFARKASRSSGSTATSARAPGRARGRSGSTTRRAPFQGWHRPGGHPGPISANSVAARSSPARGVQRSARAECSARGGAKPTRPACPSRSRRPGQTGAIACARRSARSQAGQPVAVRGVTTPAAGSGPARRRSVRHAAPAGLKTLDHAVREENVPGASRFGRAEQQDDARAKLEGELPARRRGRHPLDGFDAANWKLLPRAEASLDDRSRPARPPLFGDTSGKARGSSNGRDDGQRLASQVNTSSRIAWVEPSASADRSTQILPAAPPVA